MRLNRLVAGVVTAGLAVAGPVLVSAPAHAATVTTTTTISAMDTAYDYGDKIYISGKVTDPSGQSVYTSGSSATLQVSTPATPAWTTIATESGSGSFYFDSFKATSNAQYKVVYSGGTSGSGSAANTYTASESAPFSVTVARTVSVKEKGLKIVGKIKPDYAKKKVKILQVLDKKGKKTKKFATLKTSKKSTFSFKAPGRRGFRFIAVIPGDAMNAGTTTLVYTVI